MSQRKLRHAGRFYPDDISLLQQTLQHYLRYDNSCEEIKAIIVPHAGFYYSGEIAGKAYQLLKNQQERIQRIVVIAPSHTEAIPHSVVPSDTSFATPWQAMSVDQEWLQGFAVDNEVHQQEYAIEVQLPFLATLFPQAQLVPVLVGNQACKKLDNLLQRAWDEPNTLIIVSSDLYHYESPREAVKLGREIVQKIESLASELTEKEACGWVVIQSLLKLLKQKDSSIRCVAAQHAGQTTCTTLKQVVGYGAFVVPHSS